MWSALRCLNKIQIPSLIKPCIRKYMKTSEKMELLLKQADHVPFDYELVYRHRGHRAGGLMYHTVNFVTCITVVIGGYHLYTYGFTKNESLGEPLKMFENPIQTAIVGIVTVGMLVAASAIRYRFVIRIYHNKKSQLYRAIFTGKFPFTIEFHEFPAASLIRIDPNSALPWRSTLHNANGRNIMLFEDHFRTHADYYGMLDPSELEEHT